MERLVEQLGIQAMGKDQVSRLCAGLDEQVAAFRERPLHDARYPYLWLDAKVERVREPGEVRQKCLVIAYGVHHSRRWEVIGNSRWSPPLSAACFAPKVTSRRASSSPTSSTASPAGAEVAQLLEAAEPDLLAFYAFPAEHWSKLRSTNPLERVNREIGRRFDVIGIFPNDAALLRLAGPLLLEQNDEWLVGRRYLSQESLTAVADRGTSLHHPEEREENPTQFAVA